MRKFFADESADAKTVGTVIALFITIAISLLVVFNIAASIDYTSIDADIGGTANTPSENATRNAITQAETFYTIAPIIGIVLVAVVILRYVGMI